MYTTVVVECSRSQFSSSHVYILCSISFPREYVYVILVHIRMSSVISSVLVHRVVGHPTAYLSYSSESHPSELH